MRQKETEEVINASQHRHKMDEKLHYLRMEMEMRRLRPDMQIGIEIQDALVEFRKAEKRLEQAVEVFTDDLT